MNLKNVILNNCNYFNMKAICTKAGVGYSTFRNWKNNQNDISNEMASKLYNAMINIKKEMEEMKNKKTAEELLNEVVAMGFDKEYALDSIDRCLDEEFGYEKRENLALADEILSDELYNDILLGFQCELETKE